MGIQILLAGLGNMSHPLTRHSAGQLLIESIAARLGVSMSSSRNSGGLFGQTDVTIGEKSVSLALFTPEAAMNISGPSVAAVLRRTARSPSSLVVIHDSLDHVPGTLSPKFGGSASGHNGVRSVISALGTNDFHRLRLGIGRSSTSVAEYVLGRLSSYERQQWGANGEGVDRAWQAIEKIVAQSSAVR